MIVCSSVDSAVSVDTERMIFRNFCLLNRFDTSFG